MIAAISGVGKEPSLWPAEAHGLLPLVALTPDHDYEVLRTIESSPVVAGDRITFVRLEHTGDIPGYVRD